MKKCSSLLRHIGNEYGIILSELLKNMPKGGARPNSGPKKGTKQYRTLEKEAFRKIFMEKMREKFEDVIDAQIELACGIAIIDKKDDTGERIFDRPPSAEAGKYLTEQTMGKALQNIDVTSKGNEIGALSHEDRARIDKLFSNGKIN